MFLRKTDHLHTFRQNKNELNQKKFNLNLAWINRILIVVIAALVVGYIGSINDLSIKGFVLNDLKSKAKEMSKENNDLELKIAGLESYDNVNKKAEELKMVKVDKINYLNIVDGRVAKK